MDEKYKNYPIKFYQTKNGDVEYKSAFLNGTAKDLNDALTYVMNDLEDIQDDLFNYDDVQTTTFGKFEPNDSLKPTKGKQYLGKIDVTADLNDIFKGTNTLQHVAKNPQDKQKHDQYVASLNKSKQNKQDKKGPIPFIKKLFTKERLEEELQKFISLNSKFEEI